MNLTRPFETADLIASVAIPEVFALNVSLVADIHLHRRVPEGAFRHVLRAYVDAQFGVSGSDSIYAVLEEGLLADEVQESGTAALLDITGDATIPVPMPLIGLTYEEAVRRSDAAMNPALPRFVLTAFVERLTFHAPTDGAIELSAVFNAGFAAFEAAT